MQLFLSNLSESYFEWNENVDETASKFTRITLDLAKVAWIG